MMRKLKIRKGDTVKVLSGKDRGKTGKVLRVDLKTAKVVVEGVNLHTRFEKSRKPGTKAPAGRITLASPLPVSRLQLVDHSSGRPTRVGFKVMDNGSRQRIAKASGGAV